MKKSLLVLSALLGLASTEVRADDSLYVNVFAGPNWLNVTNHRAKATFDTGYVIGGSIGYEWCNNFRFEGEISYRWNKIKSAHFKHHGSSDFSGLSFDSSSSDSSFFGGDGSSRHHRRKLNGHMRSVAYLANVYYDIPFECSSWDFYVGGGIGYANQRFKANRHQHHNDSSSSSFFASVVLPGDSTIGSSSSSSSSSSGSGHHRNNGNNKNGFAAQGIVGLGYNFCDGMYFDVEYRYLYVKNSNNNALVFGLKADL